jgi:GT2 family glycosyltransferase
MEKPENLGVAACTCAICQPDGARYLKNRKRATLGRFLLRFLLLDKGVLQRAFPELFTCLWEKVFYSCNGTGPQEQDILQGCAILFRAEVAASMGGFSEEYRLYFTDDEICDRIREKGFSLVYVPGGRIIHRHSRSIERLSGAQQIIDRDVARYLRECLGWPAFLLAFPLYLLNGFIMRVYRKMVRGRNGHR